MFNDEVHEQIMRMTEENEAHDPAADGEQAARSEKYNIDLRSKLYCIAEDAIFEAAKKSLGYTPSDVSPWLSEEIEEVKQDLMRLLYRMHLENKK